MIVNNWTLLLLLLMMLTLLLLPPPSFSMDVIPAVHANFLEQDQVVASGSQTQPLKRISLENSRHQELKTGFILPSTLRTLCIEGSAVEQCKAACSLVLSIAKKSDLAVPGMTSSYARACSPRSLMIFSGLKAGKYLLSTTCRDTEQVCYTDPQKKPFEVTTKGSQTEEVVHLGRLMLITRRPRNVTDQGRDVASNISTYYVARENYWWTLIGVAIISSLVAVGLGMISYYTGGDHR